MQRPGIDILPVINRLSFFTPFTTAEKRRIVSEDTHFRVYHANELLIRQGSNEQSLFIILTGTVKVTDGAGDTILAILKAGDIFGEMAFLTGTRRTANVVAREAVIALKLDRMMFEQLSPEIREKFKDKIIDKLVGRLDAANKERVRLNAYVPTTWADASPSSDAGLGVSSADSPKAVLVTGRELIRQIISNRAALPSLPETMAGVLQTVRRPGSRPIQLAKIIDCDPAMVKYILKVANSAYYGCRANVSTVQHAATLLGTRRLAEVILVMSLGTVLGKAMDGYGLEAGSLWRHCIAVAFAAGQIASAVGADHRENAFITGLLHDVGKVVLDPYLDERRVRFEHCGSSRPEQPVDNMERAMLGVDHALMGAFLCKRWNLPRSISFGIRHHHRPSTAGDHQLSHIVHLANHIAIEAGLGTDVSASGKGVDETSRSMLSMDDNMLKTMKKRARLYVKTVTEHLTGP